LHERIKQPKADSWPNISITLTPLFGLAGFKDGARNKMSSREQVASRLVASRFLDSISESLGIEPNKLASVEGQFLTPNGNLVYPVRHGGRTLYVTIPED
jgi:hypothetical protein